MKKTVIISGIVVVVAIAVLVIINKLTNKEDLSLLFSEVEQAKFEILVSTTGELQAESETEIRGPEMMGGRRMRMSDITIQDLVPEGTIVKKGDYVGRLDPTSTDNTYKDELDELENMEYDYEMKKLDTTITLGDLRDDLLNQKFSMEEAEITLEQSKYEPPTTIRQNQINLDKAKRSYEQAQKNYVLKVQQAKADMRDALIDLNNQRETVQQMEELLAQFTITAPADGMVIYSREFDGTKRTVGSTIRPFDPVVASLPDMSSMISKTYVNEIDISKVSVDQNVRVTVDAFPDKKYTGKVISVANIGEQLPNTDAKVFEVVIKLDAVESILRPSMTTGNQIVTKTFEDVMFLPLECVHATEDSIPYVYMKRGYRQVVVLGESNENEVIVEQGLEPGDMVYLSVPDEPEKFRLVGEELVDVIREKAKLKREQEAEREREYQQQVERGNGGGGQGMGNPGGADRFQNMTDEEREQMRNQMQDRMQNMTDEERQQMSSRFQGRGDDQ